jgi:hypothetical protein
MSTHINNWRKDEQKVYALIVTTSIVKDISMVRRSYSTYTMKRKKQMIRNHLKLKKQRRLLLNRLLPPYLVMNWMEFATLKLSILKDISKIERKQC